MEAFFCIVLSYFVLRAFIKSERNKKLDRLERQEKIKEYQRKEREKLRKNKPKVRIEKAPLTAEEIAEAEIEKQKQRDIEELRKQGYTDDIITMIIPTINNGE